MKPDITGIAPFFIVRNVPAALSFYRDRLQGPELDDIFFGIVQRGAAMIMFKDVGVEPVPNYTRDIKQGIARWDAYLHVPDPGFSQRRRPPRLDHTDRHEPRVRSSAASRGIQESAVLDASRATSMPSPPRILMPVLGPARDPRFRDDSTLFCTEWQNSVRDGG
jgi:hypothetical protein